MLITSIPITFTYSLPPTTEDVSSASWEIAVESPTGGNAFLAMNIVRLPTASVAGEVSVTTNAGAGAGDYIVKLIRGTHDSYQTLHREVFAVEAPDTEIERTAKSE
jgi:hypothetical protein